MVANSCVKITLMLPDTHVSSCSTLSQLEPSESWHCRPGIFPNHQGRKNPIGRPGQHLLGGAVHPHPPSDPHGVVELIVGAGGTSGALSCGFWFHSALRCSSGSDGPTCPHSPPTVTSPGAGQV